MEQKIEQTVEVKPTEPKPIQATMKLSAHTFYEIIKATSAVAGYGLDPKDDNEISLTITKKGISLKAMDKARELTI